MKERDDFWAIYIKDISKLKNLCSEMIESKSVCANSVEARTKSSVFKYLQHVIKSPIERNKKYEEMFSKMEKLESSNIFLVSPQSVSF